MGLLGWLARRGVEEHPGSAGLALLHLALRRFVLRDAAAAAWRERLARVGRGDLPPDLRYAVFAREAPANPPPPQPRPRTKARTRA